MRENIKSSLYQIRNRALRDAPVYLQHVNIAELTLLRHFTAQLTLKDEQHARELELAKIDAKIEELKFIKNKEYATELDYIIQLVVVDDRLSELSKQRNELLDERN